MPVFSQSLVRFYTVYLIGNLTEPACVQWNLSMLRTRRRVKTLLRAGPATIFVPGLRPSHIGHWNLTVSIHVDRLRVDMFG
jgi:hypothetical protein